MTTDLHTHQGKDDDSGHKGWGNDHIHWPLGAAFLQVSEQVIVSISIQYTQTTLYKVDNTGT